MSGESVVAAAFYKPINQSAVHIIAEETPFHPVDHKWPDQPADRGVLQWGSDEHEVIGCVTIAIDPDGRFYSPESIPVARGADGWKFLVAHLIRPTSADPDSLVGTPVGLRVDARYRRELSAAHTASHLMALALNKAARMAWTKEFERDSLGNPDLDRAAVVKSHIEAGASFDRYRFGKSMRRAGLDVDQLVGSPAARKELTRALEEQIQSWIDEAAPITLVAESPFLDAMRWWECELSDGLARIGCGGTHLPSVAGLGEVRIEIRPTDPTEPEFEIATRPTVPPVK